MDNARGTVLVAKERFPRAPSKKAVGGMIQASP